MAFNADSFNPKAGHTLDKSNLLMKSTSKNKNHKVMNFSSESCHIVIWRSCHQINLNLRLNVVCFMCT